MNVEEDGNDSVMALDLKNAYPTAGSDAQLDRIEAKLDRILSVVEQVEAGVESAQSNPMVRQMLKQVGL